jgi:hypothetical protein
MEASDPMVKLLHHQNSFKIHREIKETVKIDITNTFILLALYRHFNRNGGVTLVYRPKSSPFSEMMQKTMRK